MIVKRLRITKFNQIHEMLKQREWTMLEMRVEVLKETLKANYNALQIEEGHHTSQDSFYDTQAINNLTRRDG